MNCLISIVLPIYNGEKYMRESIDSILNQTYQNWELLILDDCSSDQTAQIAQEYVSKDNRIHYYRNPENLRLPRNLNRGFSLAKGEYLTWTSDDNRYKPTALEKMYQALQQNKSAQFVFASCRVIDENGKDIEYIMVQKDSPKNLVGTNSVGACFMYTRKAYEVVGEYDPAYTLTEDFDYWQRIASQFQVIALEEILYEYRFHQGALTSTMKLETFYQTLERMLLKNRPGFGKIDAQRQFYFYQTLYTCRQKLCDKKNPYKTKCLWYSWIFLVQHRIPKKILRILKRSK